MKEHPYRTVLFLMFLAALELAAVAILRGGGETAQKMLSDVGFVFIGLALAQAGKSSVQYLGAGGGVKGAIQALLTSAPPGGAPPTPPSPAGGTP